MNLIPNGDFSKGLSDWEATPSGVTLVENLTKRFVMLSGDRHSAAVCSDAVEVIPAAVYRVVLERAIPGECDVSVISLGTVLKPDSSGEIIAVESPVRVQVTARAGNKIGIARVALVPIGVRARIYNVRSTVAFHPPNSPYEIACEIVNTGSAPIYSGVARLVTRHHILAEDHKQEILIKEIPIGGKVEAAWVIAKQKTARAPFKIEFDYPGGEACSGGATLKHLPKFLEKPEVRSVTGGRRWFTVGTRSLRVIGHETDYDMGPLLLSDEPNRRSLGVLHQMAQLVPLSGEPIPLWSEVSQVTPAGVTLKGKNEQANWTLQVKPDHRTKGITFDIKISGKRRIKDVNLEFGPFQTLLPLLIENGTFKIGDSKEVISLGWTTTANIQFSLVGSETAGVCVYRSTPITIMPGSVLHCSATLQKVTTGIVRHQ